MCSKIHHCICIYTFPLDQIMESDPRMWRFDDFEGFQKDLDGTLWTIKLWSTNYGPFI